MISCNTCKKSIPDDSEFCPFCGNKIIHISESSDNNESLHLYQPAALLKRAFLFLEEGHFDKAYNYIDVVLNQEPENAEAYLAKLMIDLRVNFIDDLSTLTEPFDNNINYKRVLKYGDEALKEKLLNAIKDVSAAILKREEEERILQEQEQKRQEEERRHQEEEANEDKYQIAIQNICNSDDVYCLAANDYLKKAMCILSEIPNYKDSKALYKECEQSIIYNRASVRMSTKNIFDLNAAIEEFQKIVEFKDAKEKIEECKEKIEECKKRNKKIAKITIPIICSIIAFVTLGFIFINFVVPSFQLAKLKNSNVGDYVKFGTYEQDNNEANGKEDIEWLVLEKKNGQILLISKYALDCKPYNTSYTDTTWETCTLRKWLNNVFIDSAFSDVEKSLISTAKISADKNSSDNTILGNVTQDKVFLLSINEANTYFNSNTARQCEPTEYAIANGAYVDNTNCRWWLRSLGFNQNYAIIVYSKGDLSELGYNVDRINFAVRPALWIDISD